MQRVRLSNPSHPTATREAPFREKGVCCMIFLMTFYFSRFLMNIWVPARCSWTGHQKRTIFIFIFGEIGLMIGILHG